jgi:hypothetical protein
MGTGTNVINQPGTGQEEMPAPGSTPGPENNQDVIAQPSVVERDDIMAEIREQTWAWNGVKRDLAKWAAENEGKSMTQGDVTISSSTKSSSGADARPGYHYITLKEGSTTIELLVHDASGDIARDAMSVNGVKVNVFSKEVGDTLGKLKIMIDAMKAPAAPAAPANPNTPNGNGNGNQDTLTLADRLKEALNNEQFMTGFLALVQENELEGLAGIASNVSMDSTREEKVLVLTIQSFVRDLSGSLRFRDGSFSKFGPDLEQVVQSFDKLDPEERKDYYSQWLNAMDDYLRVTADGRIVVEDDNGKQFLIGHTGGVFPLSEKLEGLQKVPDNENGRVVSFLAARALIVGHYNPAEVLGFFTQGR